MRAWIVGLVWLALVGLAGCEGPTCPPSFAREDGRCVCPVGRVLDATGAACVCAGNLVDVGGRCECPAGLVLDAAGTSCGCPEGRMLVGEACVCPSFEEENERGACVCFEGRLRDEAGACVCPEPLVPSAPSGEACVCPPPLVVGESPSECVCPAPFVPAGETCACPEGLVPDEDDGCRCPDGFVAVDEACLPTVCVGRRADCDDVEGCETDLGSDASHCGLCGAGCPEGSACVEGECTTSRPTYVARGAAPAGARVEVVGSHPTRASVADGEGAYSLEFPRGAAPIFLRFSAGEELGDGVIAFDPDRETHDALQPNRSTLRAIADALGEPLREGLGIVDVQLFIDGDAVRMTVDRPGARTVALRPGGSFEADPEELDSSVSAVFVVNLEPGPVELRFDRACTRGYTPPHAFADATTFVVFGCP